MGPFPINQSLHPPIASMGRAPTANGVPIPNWWLQLCVPAAGGRTLWPLLCCNALQTFPLIFCQRKEKHQA